MKKFVKISLVFLAVGLACGVFYREFSKAFGVTNQYLTLGLVHPHFLVLGVIMTLVLGLVSDKLSKTESKLFKAGLITYLTGVSGSGAMLLVRGSLEILEKSAKSSFVFTSGANGAISGIAGIFHAVLGVGIVLIFIALLLKDKKPME
ncbi:MAG: DUF2871 family protein [Candidatus Coproplasma sp.]